MPKRHILQKVVKPAGPTDADLKAIEAEVEIEEHDQAYAGHIDATMVRSDPRLPANGHRVQPKPGLDYYDSRDYDPSRP